MNKELNKAIKGMRKEYKRLTQGKNIDLILDPWPTIKIKTTIKWEEDNYSTLDENTIEEQIQKALDKYRNELYDHYWNASEPFIKQMDVEINALISESKEVATRFKVDESWLWNEVENGHDQNN